MKVLQANMHRSRTANDLLLQIALEHHVDLAIISEQYKTREDGLWIEDETKTAALWIPAFSTVTHHTPIRQNCYVSAQVADWTVISCYLTPSDDITTFQRKLEDIEDAAKQAQGKVILAGDFNSRAEEWGMASTNSRGRKILNMAARLGMVVANIGSAATFRRPGNEGTIPDITLVSEEMANKVAEWKEQEYKKAKKDLNIAIRKSKINKWKCLCNDVNSDPWGLGYKIVMKKLRSRRSLPELQVEQMDNIVGALFPTHEIRPRRRTVPDLEERVDMFTLEESVRSTNSLKSRKAPGPDNIPAEVLQAIAERRPNLLLDMFNACIRKGLFPKQWKLQRLVLISKV
ncbi:uncharacterized protein [Drosophila takahashii]|uniref:uncharacterized protein n=1 Tax=Drosophila takahashii TaxID=29030 RepID=UPI00389908DD